MVHELKTLPVYFNAVLEGRKNFEIRKNDRFFQQGDELLLKEWYPDDWYEVGEKECYTGRFLHRKITYILKGGQYGIENGYVILGLEKI